MLKIYTQRTSSQILNWTIHICLYLFVLTCTTGAKNTYQPKILKEDAQQTALASVLNGVVKEGELEHESGKWIWSFDILSGEKIHEIWVDPIKGNIIKSSIETTKHEAKETLLDKAEAAAIQAVPGEVISLRGTTKHGQKMYIVRVKDKNGKTHIVTINASFNVVSK